MSDKLILSGNLKHIQDAEREIRRLGLDCIPLFDQLDQLCVGKSGGWGESKVNYGNVRITIERLVESEQ